MTNQGGGKLQANAEEQVPGQQRQVTKDESNQDLVERFQQRCVELARQGTLGSLRTRKASLQNSWAHLLSLLDQPNVPILIYGEKGSGKRKLVDEFVTLQNFCRRIGGHKESRLKVFSPSFLNEGFSQLFLDPHTS